MNNLKEPQHNYSILIPLILRECLLSLRLFVLSINREVMVPNTKEIKEAFEVFDKDSHDRSDIEERQYFPLMWICTIDL